MTTYQNPDLAADLAAAIEMQRQPINPRDLAYPPRSKTDRRVPLCRWARR